MKIAFVGKGGSGKTTLASLFARSLAASGAHVLAIDADINQHLAQSLGATALEAVNIPPLGIEIQRMKEYLRGENPMIPNAHSMIKTTPPGPGSMLLTIKNENPIYRHFVRTFHGVRMMAVGPFSEEDLGTRCYHSKTGSVELLLNHLIDREREYVIVDMTAGADSFASGLFTRFDMTFVVVEPTLKSLSVYDQYTQYAKSYHVPLKVVANKIESTEDIPFIEARVTSDLIAIFPQSPLVRALERGEFSPITMLAEDEQRALSSMRDIVDKQVKDWEKYFTLANEFHVKNAKGWANQELGMNLETQVPSSLGFLTSYLSP